MKITFDSGDYKLHGKIDISKNSQKYVIYIPWMRFDINELNEVAQRFANKWYNFVRFNFRYHENGNVLDAFTLSSDLDDIHSLIKHLDTTWHTIKEIAIIAKSFGWVKWFLLNDSRIKAYSFLAPAAFFSAQWNIDKIKDIPYGKLESMQSIELSQEILHTRSAPILFIHGTDDWVIPLANSYSIYETIPCTKQIIEISWMGHSIPSEQWEKAWTTILEFFSDYV